jgi:ribonuclease T2
MQLAKLIVALTLCIGVAVADQTKDACDGDDYGTAGEFDFYVFQQEWPAEFCSGQSYPLCQNPTSYMTDHLVVHGLWPNYNSPQDGHDWPQCCQSIYGPDLNQTAINLLADDMHQYWPDEEAQPGYNTSSFWAHEWGKHGTCSGLDQYSYFLSALTVEQTLSTPEAISNAAGSSLSLADLYNAWGAPVCNQSVGDCIVSIDCNSDDQSLLHVTTCWDKDTLLPMACPYDVVKEDSCPDPVNIASFN